MCVCVCVCVCVCARARAGARVRATACNDVCAVYGGIHLADTSDKFVYVHECRILMSVVWLSKM